MMPLTTTLARTTAMISWRILAPTSKMITNLTMTLMLAMMMKMMPLLTKVVRRCLVRGSMESRLSKRCV